MHERGGIPQLDIYPNLMVLAFCPQSMDALILDGTPSILSH